MSAAETQAQGRTQMTTKSKKASSKKTATLHIELAGKGKSLCGEKGKTAPAEQATCEDCKKVVAHVEEKKAAEGKRAKKPDAAKAPAPAGERDPRVPPVGTVLRKVDRHGATRCEATVEADGFRYDGTLYKSLSAAAMAAAKDLGLGDTAQNGFVFWSLVKPAARAADPIAALEHAWDRFHAKAEGLFASANDEAVRAKLQAAVADQAKKLERLAGE